MTRQLLDEYLDNALTVAQREEVEASLVRDPNLAALLEKMKRERALRMAALAGYAPAAEEAEALAVRMISSMQDASTAPLARIGPSVWMKRLAATAAAIVVLAGVFAAGRVTAPVQVVKEITEVPVEKTTVLERYVVAYTNEANEHKTQTFASAAEAQAFVEELDLRRAVGVALANLDGPGTF